MRPPLSYMPALFPLCGFIAGMLVFECLGCHAVLLASVIGGCSLLLLFLHRHLPEWSHLIALFLLFFTGGLLDMDFNDNPDVGAFPSDTRWWNGEIIRSENNDRGCHITLRLDTIGVDALVHLPHGVAERLGVGDVVSVHASLSEPVNDDLPGSVDYVELLARKGILLTGYAAEAEYKGHHSTWRSWATEASEQVGTLLMRSSLSSGTCAFLLAVLVGDDDWLDEDTRNAFSAAGLAHVLALSGLHVGILAALLGIILMPLGLWFDWRVRCAIIIFVLWLYAFITGLSPSVTRSVLMASMMSGGIILQRPYMSFNGMLAAALIILIFSPMQLWSVGFQMSFLAVGGILLLVPPLKDAVGHLKSWIQWLVLTLAISLAAMAFTSMVAMYYFNIFPVYFLLANIPMAMLLPLLMVLGISLMLSEALGFDPLWLCRAIDMLYMLIENWTSVIGCMPSAVIKGVYFDGIMLLPYYLMLGLLVFAAWRRSRICALLGFIGIVGVIVSIGWAQSDRYEPVRFIPRNAYVTSVIYADGVGRMNMLTTAPSGVALSLRDEYLIRYRRQFDRIHADSLRVQLVGEGTCVAGNVILVQDDRVIKCGEMIDSIEFAVICRGYRGSWREVLTQLKPKVILLSADIPKRRHMQILDSMNAAGAPVLSLRDCSDLSSI